MRARNRSAQLGASVAQIALGDVQLALRIGDRLALLIDCVVLPVKLRLHLFQPLALARSTRSYWVPSDHRLRHRRRYYNLRPGSKFVDLGVELAHLGACLLQFGGELLLPLNCSFGLAMFIERVSAGSSNGKGDSCCGGCERNQQREASRYNTGVHNGSWSIALDIQLTSKARSVPSRGIRKSPFGIITSGIRFIRREEQDCRIAEFLTHATARAHSRFCLARAGRLWEHRAGIGKRVPLA